jgi:hypothetical protein
MHIIMQNLNNYNLKELSMNITDEKSQMMKSFAVKQHHLPFCVPLIALI